MADTDQQDTDPQAPATPPPATDPSTPGTGDAGTADPDTGDTGDTEDLDPKINGIPKSLIDKIVGDLGTDTKQLLQELWLNGLLGGSGEGGGGVWTNPKLTNKTVGGSNAGKNYVGFTAIEILEEILYGYDKPKFTSASISTFKNVMEVGEPVKANGVLTFGIQYPENVKPGSLRLIDHNGTIVASGFDASPQNLTVAEWTNKTVRTTSWTLKGTNTQNEDFQISINISWQARVHYGESDQDTLDAVGVQGLRASGLATSYKATYAMNAGGYKFVAYPDSYGNPAKYDNPENNMEVPVTPQAGTIQITNQYGVELTYKIIRTTLVLKGAIQLRLS